MHTVFRAGRTRDRAPSEDPRDLEVDHLLYDNIM